MRVLVFSAGLTSVAAVGFYVAGSIVDTTGREEGSGVVSSVGDDTETGGVEGTVEVDGTYEPIESPQTYELHGSAIPINAELRESASKGGGGAAALRNIMTSGNPARPQGHRWVSLSKIGLLAITMALLGGFVFAFYKYSAEGGRHKADSGQTHPRFLPPPWDDGMAFDVYGKRSSDVLLQVNIQTGGQTSAAHHHEIEEILRDLVEEVSSAARKAQMWVMKSQEAVLCGRAEGGLGTDAYSPLRALSGHLHNVASSVALILEPMLGQLERVADEMARAKVEKQAKEAAVIARNLLKAMEGVANNFSLECTNIADLARTVRGQAEVFLTKASDMMAVAHLLGAAKSLTVQDSLKGTEQATTGTSGWKSLEDLKKILDAAEEIQEELGNKLEEVLRSPLEEPAYAYVQHLLWRAYYFLEETRIAVDQVVKRSQKRAGAVEPVERIIIPRLVKILNDAGRKGSILSCMLMEEIEVAKRRAEEVCAAELMLMSPDKQAHPLKSLSGVIKEQVAAAVEKLNVWERRFAGQGLLAPSQDK